MATPLVFNKNSAYSVSLGVLGVTQHNTPEVLLVIKPQKTSIQEVNDSFLTLKAIIYLDKRSESHSFALNFKTLTEK